MGPIAVFNLAQDFVTLDDRNIRRRSRGRSLIWPRTAYTVYIIEASEQGRPSGGKTAEF